MGRLLFLIAFIFPVSSARAADFPSLLQKQKCFAKAEKILNEWKAQGSWTHAIGHKPGEEMFRTPTDAIGKWIETSINSDQLTLRLFNEKAVLAVDFDKSCNSKARMLAHKPKSQRVTPGYKKFQDRNIVELLDQKKPGVIFLWSPHKQISVEGLKQILEAGKVTHTKVFPVVDPDADASAVDRVVKELKLAKKDVYYFDSFDLQYRGFRLHHPSLIVFNDGKFTSQVRRGYEDAIVYKDYLKGHM